MLFYQKFIIGYISTQIYRNKTIFFKLRIRLKKLIKLINYRIE